MANAKKTLLSLIKSAKNELSVEESFLVDLKSVIRQLNPPRKPSKSYKPSSMNCARNMYFQIMGAEVDSIVTDPNMIRVTECGTASHEKIQYYVSKMKELGIDCEWVDVESYLEQEDKKANSLNLPLSKTKVISKKEYETKCYNERFNLSFMCDGIIKYKGEYYILEIKTETDEKGVYRTGPDEKHRRQSICYSLCLGIDKILWYYEERNYCVGKAFISEIKPTDKLEIIELIDTVDQAVASQTPPPKTDQKRICYYCPYKQECKKW